MCGSMADIRSAAAEIRRGNKKEEEERRTNHSMKIYVVSLLHRATINKGSAVTFFRYGHVNNHGYPVQFVLFSDNVNIHKYVFITQKYV